MICAVCGTDHDPVGACPGQGSEFEQTRFDPRPSAIGQDTPVTAMRPRVARTTDLDLRPPAAPVDRTEPVPREPPEDHELAVGSMVGEFRIDGQIGAGGMGVVYRATHPLIGKRAVIKVIKANLGAEPEFVERFIREARAVNQIGHPNIVDVFSFGTLADRRPYLVMEWLQGESLATRIQRGALPLREGIEILLQICSALDAAHTRGVIHRDLKPDNAYLVALPNDERPLVKLLDFGLAKIVEERDELFLEDSQSDVILGTPTYLAPEQARGRSGDHRSDVYSLGIMAFEVLTGRRPFVGASPIDTLVMHLTAPPPSARSFVADLPEACDALLVQMMAKDPDRRPSLSRIRTVLAGVLDASAAIEDAIEASNEDETTGARTSDFWPAVRRIAGAPDRDTGVPLSEVTPRDASPLVGRRGPPPFKPRSVDKGLETPRWVPLPGDEDAPELLDTRYDEAAPDGVRDSEATRADGFARAAVAQREPSLVDGSSPGMAWPTASSGSTTGVPPMSSPHDPSRVAASGATESRASRAAAISAVIAAARRALAQTWHRLAPVLRDHAAELRRIIERRLGRRGVPIVLAVLVILPIAIRLVRRSHGPARPVPQVRMWVHGLPAHSTLRWGSKTLDGNPAWVERSDDSKPLRISSPGYESLSLELVPNADLEFNVTLRAQPTSPKR